MASKGKGKEKLKKNELRVGCKVINMELFAYDIFVYSANRFGVPEECLSRWEGVTNDYGYANFIAVMTRCIVGKQIHTRHDWYKLFKGANESNKFKSFDEIKSALPRILRDTEDDHCCQDILDRFFYSLAVINELILFLYTENSGLYLKELAKFWWGFWLRDKKDLEKIDLLENIYMQYTDTQDESVEVFLNRFIPAHCIPYSEMNLKDIYSKEFNKFLKVPEEKIGEGKRKLQAELSRQANLMRTLAFQAETDVDTQQRDEASAIDISRNPGLGIREHEAVLRHAFEVDAPTSLQNLPSTSQETESQRRRSTSQKGKQKKKTGSCSSVEVLERFNIGLSGLDTKTSPQNLPSTSRQETVRNRSETSSQKEEQKKATSRSRKEESEQSNIGIPEDSGATSLQNLPSTTEKKKSKKKRK